MHHLQLRDRTLATDPLEELTTGRNYTGRNGEGDSGIFKGEDKAVKLPQRVREGLMVLGLRGLVCQTAVPNAYLCSETKRYMPPA